MANNSKPPPRLHDDQFGELELDSEMEEYSTDFIWNDHQVTLVLAFSDGFSINESLSAARKLVENSNLWFHGFGSILEKEVFPDLMECWLPQASEYKNLQTFLNKIYPEGVEINSSGFVTVNFGGIELIEDHWIAIKGDPVTGPEYSAING